MWEMLYYDKIFGFVVSRRDATILKLDKIVDFCEKLVFLKISILLEPNLCGVMLDYGNKFGLVGSKLGATIIEIGRNLRFWRKRDIVEIFDFA